MEWLVNGVYYIVPFIVLLGILVFVHEFGHFLVARLSGVPIFQSASANNCGVLPTSITPNGKSARFRSAAIASF